MSWLIFFEEASFPEFVEGIYVAETVNSVNDELTLALQDVELDIYFYHPHSTMPQASTASQQQDGQTETPPPFTVMSLPNSCMECGIEEPAVFHSLIYEDKLPTRLLHYTMNMIKLTAVANLNAFQGGWYRSMLLHGPPGSGKTTLCRALANHLAIRLDSAQTAQLITIQAQSLFSKYFGESGTLVEAAMQSILEIAADQTCLVCILIDEVESLVTSREKSAARNEVLDTIRVTNQLLTAIDRLREYPNVIMFFTSNLLSSLASTLHTAAFFMF